MPARPSRVVRAPLAGGLAALAGPTAWAVSFNAVYGVAAFACSRGISHRELAIHALNLTALLTALAALAICAAQFRALTAHHAEHSDRAQFIAGLGIIANFLAVTLIVFTASPVFVLGACETLHQ